MHAVSGDFRYDSIPTADLVVIGMADVAVPRISNRFPCLSAWAHKE